jgi:Ca2+-binding RTX toxin-like protein
MASFPTSGADIIVGTGAADSIDSLEGNDQVEGLDGNDDLDGGEGDDIIAGGSGGDTLDGSGGNDRLYSNIISSGWYPYYDSSTVPVPDRGTEVDTINGGAGSDKIFAGYGDNVDGGADNDYLYISLQGATSGVVANFLLLSAGGSMILGGGTITGIEHVTWIEGSEYDDQITGFPTDESGTIYGRGGNDYLEPNIGVSGVYGGDGNDYINRTYGYYGPSYGEAGDDTILGGQLPELLDGGDGNDILKGLRGSDTIYGGSGDDWIDGGAMSDKIYGDAGNDIIYGAGLADTIEGGDGDDLIYGDYSTLSNEQGGIPLTNNDKLYGGAGNDTMYGDQGADLLDGGSGADAMTGGADNDIYYVDDSGDTVTELDGGGVDEIRTGIGSKAAPAYALYVLPNFVENLTGTSAGAQGVRGNSLDNIIAMAGGADLIVMDDGGVDNVNAGGGNDYIYYGAALTAADVTNGGAGTDTLGLLGNYTLAFTATNLVGIERLALYTGGGTNSYSVTLSDDNVVTSTDFFVTAASLNASEILTFDGSAEMSARFTILGGGGADTITAGASNDYVAGNAGNDTLYGLGGSDTLFGGAGADQLRGGAGQDFFRYQATTDSMTGNVDQILDFTGIDRIDLSAIDAIGGGANDAFTFIGASAFHNVAGELRAYQTGPNWFVEGDVNGDGVADLLIQLTVTDANPIGAANFIL